MKLCQPQTRTSRERRALLVETSVDRSASLLYDTLEGKFRICDFEYTYGNPARASTHYQDSRLETAVANSVYRETPAVVPCQELAKRRWAIT